MNKFDDFLKNMNGKNVAVLGIGVSNTPLIKLLCKAGAVVTAHDRKSEAELSDKIDELKALGVALKTGEQYLKGLNGSDYIFRSPGIRPDVPEIAEAVSGGSVLTSEMECFFDVCPCRIIAVTGSDGKTTTTTLISKILEHAGYTCHIGGNIGTPLLDKTPEIRQNDFAVVELSSFQLFTMKKSPDAAVITNLAPNHLDIHRDMDEYVRAKENIFLHQRSEQRLVLNFDNIYTQQLLKKVNSRVTMFSSKAALECGFSVIDGKIVYRDGNGGETVIVGLDEIVLPGMHNVENFMAAAAAVMDFCTLDNVCAVAKSFSGVEHRIEFIRELDGVKYYNDSIGTSPTRTIACIRSFKTPIIIIGGGYDKHIPFDVLGEEITKNGTPVKAVVLTGATSEKIRTAIINSEGYSHNSIPVYMCDDMKEALLKAKAEASEGDAVILSPACAAFDRFKNFAERGKIFKEMVNSLDK